jgi:hypothetical protein
MKDRNWALEELQTHYGNGLFLTENHLLDKLVFEAYCFA